MPKKRSICGIPETEPTRELRLDLGFTITSSSLSLVTNNSRFTTFPAKHPPKSKRVSWSANGLPGDREKNTSCCLMAMVVN